MQTVLIVDDDSSYRKILAQKLVNEGFSVLSAVDGKDALNKIRNNGVDLILLDLLMPEMDGIEFIYHLKEEIKKEIPIIVLTNLTQTALPMGIKQFFVKSDTPIERVVEAIKKYTTLSKELYVVD